MIAVEQKQTEEIPLGVGEDPGNDVPGQRIFDKEEVQKGSKRLEELKKWAKNNKQRIVIFSAVSGLVTITVGTALMLKYFTDEHPDADITDK